jgi:hypothetical protein
MIPFFRCAECGDHVKATEYGECAYCGGDVEIIDGGEMIDIETMDRDALIAEIRRLRDILSDYANTPQAELMLKVEKLKRENRALRKMVGERHGAEGK